jgi:signal transduction histidine kinase
MAPLAYVAALAAGTVLAAGLLPRAIRHHPSPGSRPMTVLLVGTVVWNLTTLAAVLVAGPASKLFIRAAYVGVGLGVVGFLLFAVEYAGWRRYVTRPVVALLLVEPALAVALSFTNPAHGLWWTPELTRAPATVGGYTAAHGPAFYLHSGYSFALVGIAVALLVDRAVGTGGVYQRQATVVVAAALVPLAASVAFVAGLTGIDLTPPALAVTALLFHVGTSAYGLMDVVPVAKDAVLDTVDNCVLVVDREGRITYVNDAARDLLGVEPVADLDALADRRLLAAVRDRWRGHAGDVEVVAVDTGTGRRHYRVEASTLAGSREAPLGQVFVLTEVTERVRRERELERRNDQLDRFASLVSHDLRNPINVARGHVDLARDTGDLSELGPVDEALDRMEQLIDDVLALTREGRAVENPEPVALATVARDAWSHVDTGDAELVVETDWIVRADEGRLLSVFENLFRNAVEHGSTSPPQAGDAVEHGYTGSRPEAGDAGPGITVTVGDDGSGDGAGTGDGRFYVADDGVGIPPDEREHVLADAYSTTEDGTGLGLSIVVSVAQAHGWEVEVTESEDSGARFDFVGVTPLEERERDDWSGR